MFYEFTWVICILLLPGIEVPKKRLGGLKMKSYLRLSCRSDSMIATPLFCKGDVLRYMVPVS